MARAGMGAGERRQVASAQTLSAPDLVGSIVSERRPTISVAARAVEARSSAPGEVDLCRLLVAILGVSVYLGVPAALIAYSAIKLIG